MKMTDKYALGCRLPLDEWVQLNEKLVFDDPTLKKHVAPFPPVDLMVVTSGLDYEQGFAAHGSHFFKALGDASPVPLLEFKHILDFGCGSGRLARMFKGHPGKLTGCDIDYRLVNWIRENLTYMDVHLTKVNPPLPFQANTFDAIVSISIFTHLSEASQRAFLAELWRISTPGGYIFLTVHGKRALSRAQNEKQIWEMISVDLPLFQNALAAFDKGEFAFILQNGHLTNAAPVQAVPPATPGALGKIRRYLRGNRSDAAPTKGRVIDEVYHYGITFIPESYIRTVWSEWFTIVDYRQGALHDFQDIVVLQPKK